jgi:hypothetical protein
MTSKELNQKLIRLFGLGWEVGSYEALSKPASHEALREEKEAQFAERDRLIAEIAQNSQ